MMKEADAMTIQITKPEVEALINQRLRSGGFKDAEDVVWQAFSPRHRKWQQRHRKARNLQKTWLNCSLRCGA